tara:strand:+ start:1029 stop:1634 length:606 start_codon:yes stop_codon:yes gene_type:complete
MIVIANYGVGNLSSVKNMLKKAGASVKISADPSDILSADKLLLPGVGNYDYGMQMLNKSKLREAIDKFALDYKRPVLGICLGAQILGKRSEEGTEKGLGWLDFECLKFKSSDQFKIPNMGWRSINVIKDSLIFNNIDQKARFYFVHSYYIKCNDSKNIISTSQYSINFCSAVNSNNIWGTQFHPEKSLRYGLSLMKSFANL